MQITMNDMATINQVLNEHKGDKMPVRTAYKFNKLVTSFTEDYKFFQEKYREILFKYCQKKEDGSLFIDEHQNFIVLKEHSDEYVKDMNELLLTTIEIPDIKFSLDELENIEITIQEMSSLSPIIEE